MCEGRYAESPHTGLSQRAFPQRRDSGNRHDLTQQTHLCPILCALGDQISSHSLSSCSTTNLRQTTGCVSPDRRVNCFSLSLCQPGNFVPTRLQRHGASESRVSCLCAPHLVSLRLDSPQEVSLRDSPVRSPPHSNKSLTFFLWHRHLSGLDH